MLGLWQQFQTEQLVMALFIAFESQISNIKEIFFLLVKQVVFRASQNVWLSVQTLKFWFSHMAFLLSPSERLLATS